MPIALNPTRLVIVEIDIRAIQHEAREASESNYYIKGELYKR